MKKRRWGACGPVGLLLAAVFFSGCRREQGPRPGGTETLVAGPTTGGGEVQAAVVAGRFYPAEEKELQAMIRSFLAQAGPVSLAGVPLGFMVPHAGYIYSGPVAAYVYQAIKASGRKKFVIMGPAHRVDFSGVYVMDKAWYRTPLGEVRLDRQAARRLAAARPWISTDERLYDHEHSVEVQIPFLQEAVGRGLSVVVMVIGEVGLEQCAELAQILDETFPGDEEVFLASTDMAHGNYPPYMGTDQVRPIDLHTLELIQAMDFPALSRGLSENSTPLCGGRPVLTLLYLFQRRGGGRPQVLKYADSGDTTGDHSRVVGYGAVAFMQGAEKKAAGSPADYFLSEAEKLELLKMARARVEAAVRGQRLPEFATTSPVLQKPGAAFVTLKTRGELRGCIGSIVAAEPLYLCVQRRAVDAALHDSRFIFNPIRPAELAELEIEISVLTPLTRIQRPEDVVVGRDGVALSLGPYHGVFLPQVPLEQGWEREQYLSHLCAKAGISDPACYRDPRAALETFRAIVFSEREMGLK